MGTAAEKITKGNNWGPQLKRTAISDEVISRFRQLIANRVLVPGCQLPTERELAENLGVSRPTLRQATKALQLLGIIRSRQGDGSYLAESTNDMLRAPLEFAIAFKGMNSHSLLETREAIEVKLAALAAIRHTEDDARKMQEALDGMKSSMPDPDLYCDWGLRFHEAIAQASQNSVMVSIMEMLSGLLEQGRRESVRALHDFDTSYQQHEGIYLGILSRSPQKAAEAMAAHFSSMEDRAHDPLFLDTMLV